MANLSTLLRPPPTRPRYGAVLVPVRSTRASKRLTKAAAALANDQGSQLFGLSCAPGVSDRPADAVEQEAVHLVVEASGERFDALTREVRAGRSWRRCEGCTFETLRSHAWAGDLIMLGASELQEETSVASLRRLLARTACPVLIWPEGREVATIRHAAVLCDDSRAAARAMRAAAPLLVRCRRISLVGGAGRLTEDARRGLEGRGVSNVEVVALERAVSAAAAERLAGVRADLMVVGAWSEFLGGWPRRSVTDILLDRSPTPLLLAA